MTTVVAFNTSKSIVRVTAIKIAVNDFFHIRPEKTILSFKAIIIGLFKYLTMILNTAIIFSVFSLVPNVGVSSISSPLIFKISKFIRTYLAASTF